jgi:hypothetical protein
MDIVLKVGIPDLKLVKAMRFNSADSVWAVKKQIAAKFTELNQGFNFGIFVAGADGNGKFLDDHLAISSFQLQPMANNH